MDLNQKQTDALLGILEYEQTHEREDYSLGWRWSDVRVAPATLNSLIQKGLLEEEFHSNSHRGLLLTDTGREQAALLMVQSETSEESPGETVRLPTNMFEDVIGHDDVKELLTATLAADKPVHVLLAGPPALAKSLFLWDIERVCGRQALWLVGSATSKAGLWDMVAEREPQVLFIDELDKMSAADTAALLSLMEGGRLVRAKKGRALDATVAVRIVAATNQVGKLSPELRSRFAVMTLKAYDAVESRSVVEGVLARREGVSTELAGEIARKLSGRCQDVRDAVRVARLSPHLGIDKTIGLLLG